MVSSALGRTGNPDFDICRTQTWRSDADRRVTLTEMIAEQILVRVLIAIPLVGACSGHHDADRERAKPDPWAAPPPAAVATAKPPSRLRSKLSMDGKIEGAAPALLAMPLPGYADTKVGDWRAYRYITTGKLGDFHATAIAVVIAATPTTVTIEFSGRLDETGEQRSDGATEFPRAYTVEHEIHHQHGDWTASGIELTTEVRTIEGHHFSCQKLASAFADPLMPGKDTRVEVWLSPEVPAGGVVASREVQKAPALTITSTADLIGFGDADHTTWGKRPAGL
jgi:hypothetical protein